MPVVADLSNIQTFLRRLAQEGFWGNVTLIFQHGDVIRLVKEESLLANTLKPDNRSTNEYHPQS